jgi:hypothetical protein
VQRLGRFDSTCIGALDGASDRAVERSDCLSHARD